MVRTAQTCVAEATTLVTQGRFEDAIDRYLEAVGLDPHHINAFLDLGNTYIKVNKFDLAIEAFKNAIQLNPQMPTIYRCLGNAYRFKGDYDQAQKNYAQSLKLNDKISQTYDDMGLLFIKSENNHQKAVQNFEKAIDLDGFNLHALNNAAKSYIALENPQKATLFNQKALLINPDSHDAQQIKTQLEHKLS